MVLDSWTSLFKMPADAETFLRALYVLRNAAPAGARRRRAHPLFGRRIVWEGRRLFLADPEADRAFVRDVQLQAADLEPFLRRMRAIKLEALAR